MDDNINNEDNLLKAELDTLLSDVSLKNRHDSQGHDPIRNDSDSRDGAFNENGKTEDHFIDKSFDEERALVQKILQGEVKNAASMAPPSKASIFRMRTREPSEIDLNKESVALPNIEDHWDGSDETQKTSNRKTKVIIAVFIFIFSALCIWALLLATNSEESIKVQSLKIDSKKEQADREYYLNRSAARDAIQNFIEATSIEERVKYSRNPGNTLGKMTTYYQNKAFDNYQFISINKLFEVRIKNQNFIMASAFVKKLSGDLEQPNEKMNFLIEKQEDYNYLVDWELMVVYQPDDWDDFVASRSDDPHIFRVEARQLIEVGPYLYEFSDDNIYQAYRLSIRGEDEKFLIGYAKKDSEVDLQMKERVAYGKFKKKHNKTPMALKLVFPKDAQSDQCVEIIEIVSDTWMIP